MRDPGAEHTRKHRNNLVAIRLGLYGGAISLDVYRDLRYKLLAVLSYWHQIARKYGGG